MNFEALNKGSNGEMIKENSVPVMNEGNIYAGFWKPYLGSHLGSPAELSLMAKGGEGGGGKARFHSLLEEIIESESTSAGRLN